LDALDVAGYKTLPVYITKEGAWYAGKPLGDLAHFRGKGDIGDLPGVSRVILSPDRSARQLVSHPHAKKGLFSRAPELWADVFLPCVHGTFGEDGTLQGVFEMADVPYSGCGVLAAALSMDKIRSKAVCQAAGLPILQSRWISRDAWKKDSAAFVAEVESLFPYPVIVKPSSLGSSIGVRRCNDVRQLREGMETALVFDERVMVEPALVNFREVNCAVLGAPSQASVCEMPSYSGDFLSFDSKYRAGGKNGAKGFAPKGSKSGMAAAWRRSIARYLRRSRQTRLPRRSDLPLRRLKLSARKVWRAWISCSRKITSCTSTRSTRCPARLLTIYGRRRGCASINW
jgi:D-alanine-D-alanine ligase